MGSSIPNGGEKISQSETGAVVPIHRGGGVGGRVVTSRSRAGWSAESLLHHNPSPLKEGLMASRGRSVGARSGVPHRQLEDSQEEVCL